jgi:hypothetical protein
MTISEMLEQYTPSRGGTKAHLAVILEYAQKRFDCQIAHGETPRQNIERVWQKIQTNETTPDLEAERMYIRMYYRVLEQYGETYEWPFDWR